jgi:hypothetical protein
MADQLGRSVGDMYAGAFIPGIMLACLYAVFTLGIAIFKRRGPPRCRSVRGASEPDGVGRLVVRVPRQRLDGGAIFLDRSVRAGIEACWTAAGTRRGAGAGPPSRALPGRATSWVFSALVRKWSSC